MSDYTPIPLPPKNGDSHRRTNTVTIRNRWVELQRSKLFQIGWPVIAGLLILLIIKLLFFTDRNQDRPRVAVFRSSEIVAKTNWGEKLTSSSEHIGEIESRLGEEQAILQQKVDEYSKLSQRDDDAKKEIASIRFSFEERSRLLESARAMRDDQLNELSVIIREVSAKIAVNEDCRRFDILIDLDTLSDGSEFHYGVSALEDVFDVTTELVEAITGGN